MDKRLEALDRLFGVMERLRKECPWDREQTFETLLNNTIEETYELVDAVNSGKSDEIREELGDLLLHVVFYSKIGSESFGFDFADVANGICDKLIYRHPHIYGDVDADNTDIVKQNWEALKLAEKKRKGKKEGTLSGVPRSLPAMVKAFRIGEKVASVGFDWEEREDAWDKVREEIAEVEVEMKKRDDNAMEEEMGDLFFSLINVCRLYGVDPENALQRCNNKFTARFNSMESEAAAQKRKISEYTINEMEEMWQRAKKEEK